MEKYSYFAFVVRKIVVFFVTENRGRLYKLFGDPLSVFDATIEGARENFSVFGTTAYDFIILKF